MLTVVQAYDRAPIAELPFDDAAARHYADIRHHLEVQGRIIGANDLKIQDRSHRPEARPHLGEQRPGFCPRPWIDGGGLGSRMSLGWCGHRRGAFSQRA